MENESKHQDWMMTTTSGLISHVGVPLLKISPVRRLIVRTLAWRINHNLKRSRASSELPPGVQDDRAVMGLALLRTIERLLAERRVSKGTLDFASRLLAYMLVTNRSGEKARQEIKAQKGHRPPAFLVISPGKACNLHCKGCYADSDRTGEKISWSTLDRIVTEAEQDWARSFIVISGGEPLAYRSEGKGILDLAQKHNRSFMLFYTNGTLIDDQIAERLARLGNLTPAISVEGWRETTDARRGDGIFDQVLAAMQRLRQAGVLFGVSLTATRHNVEELLSEEFIDFLFEEQQASYGWIFHYMPIGRSYTLELMPTPQQRLWMWRRSWEIIRQRQIFLADFWNHGTAALGCLSAGNFQGMGYMYINWKGSVNPCVFVPYSPININQVYASGGTLTDAWKDVFFASIRRWQESYQSSSGNWMAPCIIRDHHADLRRLIARYEPDPDDESARQALLDGDYAQGMDDYDQAYQALTQGIWQDYYLRKAGAHDGHIQTLPELPFVN
jgi:MoaA/NifB/PqqE/SkfB family radical SAM enzyme